MISGDSEDDKDNNNDEDVGGWRWGCNDEDDGDDILLVRSNFLYLFLKKMMKFYDKRWKKWKIFWE